MMKSFFSLGLRLGFVVASLVIVSCGPKEKDSDDKDSDAEKSQTQSGATFDDSKGLQLKEETKQALGLEFTSVTTSSVKQSLSLHAQVYRAANEPVFTHTREQAGSAYATASIKAEDAAKLTPGQKSISSPEAYLWRIVPTMKESTEEVEALLRLPDFQADVGSMVDVAFDDPSPAKTILSIPPSALLRNSAGTFVYLQKDDYLRRVEVEVGSQSTSYVEIIKGLQLGETIVKQPVQEIYLIELRLTKGGGEH